MSSLDSHVSLPVNPLNMSYGVQVSEVSYKEIFKDKQLARLAPSGGKWEGYLRTEILPGKKLWLSSGI